jgi:uncharacterized protein (TIGR00369 family)
MDFELVRKTLQGQGFMKLIGARVDRIEKGLCELSVDFREELTQQHGFFHGGLTAFLIDNATTAAAGTVVREDRVVLTAEYKLNFLSPAVGERLVCRASVIKPGSMLTVVEGKVFAVKDGQEKLVAVALASIANVPAERVG